LRFYVTGSSLISARNVIGVIKSFSCLIVRDVSLAIAKLRTKYIKMLETEIRNLQKDFYSIAKFPLVIGAIDCMHIKIQSPGKLNKKLVI
jgi:hypothetical protein